MSIRHLMTTVSVIILAAEWLSGAGLQAQDITPKSPMQGQLNKQEETQCISVEGGFHRPGKLAYSKGMTLILAVMEAGNVAPDAKLSEGVIVRHPDSDPTRTKVIAFNWKNIQKGKDKDIALMPGDSIYLTPGRSYPQRYIWYQEEPFLWYLPMYIEQKRLYNEYRQSIGK